MSENDAATSANSIINIDESSVDSDANLGPYRDVEVNLSGPFLRGIDSLIHETAKNEMLRDYHFSRVLAQKKKELSQLSEDDLLTRYHRSHIVVETPATRAEPPCFLPPPFVAHNPLQVEDTFSWVFWTATRPSELEPYPTAYEIVRRPSILAVVGGFTPSLKKFPDYSLLVANLVSTSS